MKKFYLFLCLLSASHIVFGQTQINLTFVGKDAKSQSILSLDSISLKNVTENCDTVLIPTNTTDPVSWIIENATWPVGIDEFNAGSSGEITMEQNYPNPFRGATTINIYKKHNGTMNLVLYDGSGKKLATFQNEFEKGLHSFAVSSSTYGVSVLTVSDATNTKTIKLLNTHDGKESNNIQYLGQIPDGQTGIFKSSEDLAFSFYLGNEMKFTAYASGYADLTITDNPTLDRIYTFNMTLLSLPEVETSSVTDITQSNAKCGGNVNTDGGEPVTSRGVCWNTTGSPTTNDSFTVDGDGTGYFTSTLSGLTPDTRYYVSAYATNNSGTVYGEDVTFKTSMPLLETEADINDTLLYCYSKLYDYNELLYLFDAVYSNDFPAPDASWTEIFNHSQTQSSENEKIYMLWANAFDIIYKTNLVIQSSEIVITDQQTHDQIIAQAKAIRAYLYYNLVNWFGVLPIETGTAEGVIPRAMIEEVLSFIKQDVRDASQSLPASWPIPDKFRIPQSFAKALLSRAFLFTQNYDEALNSTQQIISSGMYALDANPANFTSAGTEILWGFEKSNNTEFNTFFDKGSFVPVIRYTESFLVEAEALFKTGNTSGAINYINMLNSRRGLPVVSSLTSDALFQHWNTELVKEGNMFSTLKRFGKALPIVQDYPHKLLLPVPLPFIISNVYLTQNAGY
jgi:hypothetical protein